MTFNQDVVSTPVVRTDVMSFYFQIYHQYHHSLNSKSGMKYFQKYPGYIVCLSIFFLIKPNVLDPCFTYNTMQ